MSQAESALKAQNYADAIKLCDSALRLDAGNSDAQRILKIAQPRFDAQEKSRKSGLSRTELLKEVRACLTLRVRVCDHMYHCCFSWLLSDH